MIKRLIIAIICLVLVCGGLVGFNLFRSKKIKDFFANMQQPAQTVSTLEVKTSVWKSSIDAIGTANASEGVDLTVEVAGIVKDIHFKANDHVHRGDILVQLDDTIQKADLIAAQSTVVLNEQNLNRAEALRTRSVGTVSSVDTAKAAAQSARAQVEKFQATLAQKRLVAPFSGTIGIVKVDTGQYITPGTTIVTLQNLDTMRVDFTVPEQFLSSLKIGQPIDVGSTEGGLEFSGKIIGVDPKIDSSTRLVSVRADVKNTDAKLHPGQFVHVRVELPEEKNVIALPQTSIVTSLYGDYVFVVRSPQAAQEKQAAQKKDVSVQTQTTPSAKTQTPNESLVVHQVFVKLGQRSLGVIEVRDGLKEGDIVVTAGQNRLNQGMRVAIDNTVNPADAMKQK